MICSQKRSLPVERILPREPLETAIVQHIQRASLQAPVCDSNKPALKPQLAPDQFGGLSLREVEVLRLLAMGLTNNAIAKQLVLSSFTVNKHIQSTYNKLKLHSRSAATRYAIEHQII